MLVVVSLSALFTFRTGKFRVATTVLGDRPSHQLLYHSNNQNKPVNVQAL